MNATEIISALFMIAMLFVLIPSAKRMIKNSPKGTTDDWMGFIIPIIAIMGFIALLVAII